MPRSGKLPVLRKFTHMPYSQAKNRVFRPAGAIRCTDSRQTWHDWRTRGSAWLCKISPQSAQGVGMRPQNMKNFHFLVKSRLAGATLWPISENFKGFYTPNYPAFQIWRDLLHRLRSYCWETARRSITPNFSVHPVGKTALDQKLPPFWWPRRALSPCKVWGRWYNARRL